MDLDAGTYALIPFTSGCYLKPPYDNHHNEATHPHLIADEGGSVVLTPECLGALEEIFYRIDLDGNGSVSRTEFDFFQEVTSGELCDDDAWSVILSKSNLVHKMMHAPALCYSKITWGE